jgi:apolipoprotein N-acyltransferase
MAKKDPQPYERASAPLKWYEIILNNLLGGISWGIGATVGLAIFFWLLTMIAKNIDLVPIFGSFISDIIDFILATNPRVGQDK